MKRSMMQIYVKDSVEAVLMYQKALDATVVSEYKNEDGSYMHAELNEYGQIIVIPESTEERQELGNTMQFCFHFGKKHEETCR